VIYIFLGEAVLPSAGISIWTGGRGSSEHRMRIRTAVLREVGSLVLDGGQVALDDSAQRPGSRPTLTPLPTRINIDLLYVRSCAGKHYGFCSE
jgi:hypothetical protein